MISDRFIYDDRKTYVIFGAAESGIKCLQILLANGLKNICFAGRLVQKSRAAKGGCGLIMQL